MSVAGMACVVNASAYSFFHRKASSAKNSSEDNEPELQGVCGGRQDRSTAGRKRFGRVYESTMPSSGLKGFPRVSEPHPRMNDRGPIASLGLDWTRTDSGNGQAPFGCSQHDAVYLGPDAWFCELDEQGSPSARFSTFPVYLHIFIQPQTPPWPTLSTSAALSSTVQPSYDICLQRAFRLLASVTYKHLEITFLDQGPQLPI